jgi:hypothetical protein
VEVCNVLGSLIYEGLVLLGFTKLGAWVDRFPCGLTSVRALFATGSLIDVTPASVCSVLAFSIIVSVWAGLAAAEPVPAGCSSQTVVAILLLEGSTGDGAAARAAVNAEGAPLGKSG